MLGRFTGLYSHQLTVASHHSLSRESVFNFRFLLGKIVLILFVSKFCVCLFEKEWVGGLRIVSNSGW